jgi:hypothetical protein
MPRLSLAENRQTDSDFGTQENLPEELSLYIQTCLFCGYTGMKA